MDPQANFVPPMMNVPPQLPQGEQQYQPQQQYQGQPHTFRKPRQNQQYEGQQSRQYPPRQQYQGQQPRYEPPKPRQPRPQQPYQPPQAPTPQQNKNDYSVFSSHADEDDVWETDPNMYPSKYTSLASTPKPAPARSAPAPLIPVKSVFSNFPASPAKATAITRSDPAPVRPALSDVDKALMCITAVHGWFNKKAHETYQLPPEDNLLVEIAINALETKDLSAYDDSVTYQTIAYHAYITLTHHIQSLANRGTKEEHRESTPEEAFMIVAKLENCNAIFDIVKTALLSWNPTPDTASDA